MPLCTLKHQPVDSSDFLQVQLEGYNGSAKDIPPSHYTTPILPRSTGHPGPAQSTACLCPPVRRRSVEAASGPAGGRLTSCPAVLMVSTTVFVTIPISRPASLPSSRHCLCSSSSFTPVHKPSSTLCWNTVSYQPAGERRKRSERLQEDELHREPRLTGTGPLSVPDIKNTVSPAHLCIRLTHTLTYASTITSTWLLCSVGISTMAHEW